MRQTAARAAVAALVIGGVVVLALALWKLKVLIALLFLAFIISAAMRPSVEALARRNVPRVAAILLHYAAIVGLLVALLTAVVPRALDQVENALGGLPSTRAELRAEARSSDGIKNRILVGIEERLERLPRPEEYVRAGAEVTLVAFEIFIGIFFVLACAAYWIYERERAVRLVTSVLPRPRRKLVRDTWNLIDLKLGAYVRGQALLILLVATVLGVIFWAIGLPFWLLIAIFAGVVEIIPVIGPLAAGALAVGVGLTVSWQVALAAGVAVLVVRLIEDYVVIPRVLGDAVGLSPLVVLISVTTCAILFGEWAVLLAIPLAAVAATLIDVVVLDKDPAEEDVPTVIFAAKEVESSSG
jgi:predicted PurR-regulated permease PerM